MTSSSTLEAKAASPAAEWLLPFVPRRGLRNPHLQTIVGNFLRRPWAPVPPPEPLVVPVEAEHDALIGGRPVHIPASKLLCLCHWQPAAARRERLTVVLVHGLEGSASSGYVLGSTALLWAAGCNVVRMNMRSCGGSDALAPTIYHSGRFGDVGAVVDALEALGQEHIALVGYSMGGNLVLGYAGQCAPRGVRAVAGVSPLLDLAASSAALHLPANRLYEARFLRAMKLRLRLKAQLFPQLYAGLEQEGVYHRIRSMREFDGEIVARFGGFRDADDYYEQVRSSRYASAFAIPTLILHAADDPFLRTIPDTRAALLANPRVTYIETRHGGHCAFLSEPGDADRGRWAEATVARWLQAARA